MTAMVLPNGQVASSLAPFTAGALMVEAQGYQELTPYAQWGNALALLLALAACLPAWRMARRMNPLGKTN
jgi:apolipoprotein N-acyltransferase